jgi:peptidoglycan/LPS O-acetylase OafA/YrhL
LAVLIAAGFAFSYALDGQGIKPGTTEEEGSLDLIRNVLIIGIITLISTRLYGNLGLIVVAATCSVSFFRQAPAIAALYVAARVLEQTFDTSYVANVTGINLMHSYVSAAQYFGFFTVVALLLLLKEGRGRQFETIAVTSVAVIGPALVNYFLHAEASASYMVALTVAGVLAAILGQKFFAGQENHCASLMLIASQSSAVGLLAAELISIGNTTSNPERLKVVYCLAGVVAILMIVSLLRSKKGNPENGPQPPSVEVAPAASE